jgi:enoyl-CoA hydratase/carnithine racemase
LTEPTVLRSERGPIIELVLNRPEKLNALTSEMFETIRAAVDDLRDRDDLRVLLIRAKGRYFSAGVDLHEGRSEEGFTNSPTKARTWMRGPMKGGMHVLLREMELVEKPIVVAHHATCVGGALELSLSCDFRLAAKSAGYSFPEMVFGMLPLSNGISKMTRVVGPHWTKWLSVANESVTADRALIMGLVHEVYPDETFEQEVWAFCERLASKPPEAIAAGKLAVELAADLSIEPARQLERLTFSSLTFTREHDDLAPLIRARLSRNAKT